MNQGAPDFSGSRVGRKNRDPGDRIGMCNLIVGRTATYIAESTEAAGVGREHERNARETAEIDTTGLRQGDRFACDSVRLRTGVDAIEIEGPEDLSRCGRLVERSLVPVRGYRFRSGRKIFVLQV